MAKFFISDLNRPAIRESLVAKVCFDSSDYVIYFYGYSGDQLCGNVIAKWEYDNENDYLNEVCDLKIQLKRS